MITSTLSIDISTSRYFSYGLLFSYLGAIVVIGILELNRSVSLFLIFLLFSNLLFYFRLYVWRVQKNSITRLTINQERQCQLKTYDGQLLEGELKNSVTWPLFVIVYVRLASKRFSKPIIIFSDSVSFKTLHHLRVLLTIIK